jgi:hypothetical protein
MKGLRALAGLSVVVAAGAVGGCDSDGIGPGPDVDPRDLNVRYAWVFETFDQTTPLGYPAVELSWELPSRYRDEVFRVYSRRSSSGGYRLIATVTSCSEGVCRYSDINVAGGESYDYYIASFDERDGVEVGVSDAIRVDVPQRPALTPPVSPSVVALDDAVFVRWGSTGALKYLVFVRQSGGVATFIGETDGLDYLDTRATNGEAYRYFVAGVDEFGHVSSLSQTSDAFPRPDYYADIVYAHSDNAAASGFRFVTSETQDPIVGGASPTAQWRLEMVGGLFRIQPLGQTAITTGTFTTTLSCGPGSDADCEDIRTAPPATQFGLAPVDVQTGHTYVLRVVGTDNLTRFAKIRVQGTTTDSQGRRLMVFDWAYQLRTEEPSLDLVGK